MCECWETNIYIRNYTYTHSNCNFLMSNASVHHKYDVSCAIEEIHWVSSLLHVRTRADLVERMENGQWSTLNSWPNRLSWNFTLSFNRIYSFLSSFEMWNLFSISFFLSLAFCCNLVHYFWPYFRLCERKWMPKIMNMPSFLVVFNGLRYRLSVGHVVVLLLLDLNWRIHIRTCLAFELIVNFEIPPSDIVLIVCKLHRPINVQLIIFLFILLYPYTTHRSRFMNENVYNFRKWIEQKLEFNALTFVFLWYQRQSALN